MVMPESITYTRRRWPRLEVVDLVQVTVGVETHIVIVNVGGGGFLAFTPRPFSPGDIHELRFRTEEPVPRALLFLAKVIHCAPVVRPGIEAHAVGLAFVPPQTEQQRSAIEHFLQLCSIHLERSTGQG